MHGLRAFELGRVEQLVVYLARRCPGPFKTKVAKLLWLADFGHFGSTASPSRASHTPATLTGRRRTTSPP